MDEIGMIKEDIELGIECQRSLIDELKNGKISWFALSGIVSNAFLIVRDKMRLHRLERR